MCKVDDIGAAIGRGNQLQIGRIHRARQLQRAHAAAFGDGEHIRGRIQAQAAPRDELHAIQLHRAAGLQNKPGGGAACGDHLQPACADGRATGRSPGRDHLHAAGENGGAAGDGPVLQRLHAAGDRHANRLTAGDQQIATARFDHRAGGNATGRDHLQSAIVDHGSTGHAIAEHRLNTARTDRGAARHAAAPHILIAGRQHAVAGGAAIDVDGAGICRRQSAACCTGGNANRSAIGTGDDVAGVAAAVHRHRVPGADGPLIDATAALHLNPTAPTLQREVGDRASILRIRIVLLVEPIDHAARTDHNLTGNHGRVAGQTAGQHRLAARRDKRAGCHTATAHGLLAAIGHCGADGGAARRDNLRVERAHLRRRRRAPCRDDLGGRLHQRRRTGHTAGSDHFQAVSRHQRAGHRTTVEDRQCSCGIDLRGIGHTAADHLNPGTVTDRQAADGRRARDDLLARRRGGCGTIGHHHHIHTAIHGLHQLEIIPGIVAAELHILRRGAARARHRQHIRGRIERGRCRVAKRQPGQLDGAACLHIQPAHRATGGDHLQPTAGNNAVAGRRTGRHHFHTTGRNLGAACHRAGGQNLRATRADRRAPRRAHRHHQLGAAGLDIGAAGGAIGIDGLHAAAQHRGAAGQAVVVDDLGAARADQCGIGRARPIDGVIAAGKIDGVVGHALLHRQKAVILGRHTIGNSAIVNDFIAALKNAIDIIPTNALTINKATIFNNTIANSNTIIVVNCQIVDDRAGCRIE